MSEPPPMKIPSLRENVVDRWNLLSVKIPARSNFDNTGVDVGIFSPAKQKPAMAVPEVRATAQLARGSRRERTPLPNRPHYRVQIARGESVALTLTLFALASNSNHEN